MKYEKISGFSDEITEITKEQFEALKETPYTKEDLNSLCDRKELVQTLYKEDKEFIDSCGKTDVQKLEKVYS